MKNIKKRVERQYPPLVYQDRPQQFLLFWIFTYAWVVYRHWLAREPE